MTPLPAENGPTKPPKSGNIDEDGVGRRHEVRDARNGEVIVRMLGFPGPAWVRMVCVGELQRDGYTLTRDEAEEWRDALTEAIEEIDAFHDREIGDYGVEYPGTVPANAAEPWRVERAAASERTAR